jgi:catechol 2,3-dioxygenase-like lactoylglutathione lyase family enzyme
MDEKAGELARKLKLPRIRHMGIIVEDIGRAVEYYSSAFGLGPWFKARFGADENYLRGEQKINTEYETASAFSGGIEYQLIRVVGGDRDACIEHYEKHGEGFHHVGVYVNNIEERLRAYEELGIGVLQTGTLTTGGKFYGNIGGTVTKYAYLDTESVGGVIFELIQIGFMGTHIASSRFWFELGAISGALEKTTRRKS